MESTIELAIFEAATAGFTTLITTLFYKQSKAATERMDKYHAELWSTQQLENRLLACETIENFELRDKSREFVITATLENSQDQ